MEENHLKNIVVLKNLSSNIVDEAIIILKPNKKIKKIEVVDNNKNSKFKKKKLENNLHVINEAEMIINGYIEKIEKKKIQKDNNKYLINKYKRLKKYSIVSSIILIMSMVLHLV